MKDQFLQYGAIGLMAFVFLGAVIIMDRRYNKILLDQIKELKNHREEENETVKQFLRNQNRLIENQNDLIKGFIDISAGFKALVNVMVEKPGNSGL